MESLVPAPKRIFKYCFESVPHLYPYPELSIPEIGFLENIPIFDGSNIINDGSILIFVVGFHFWTPFFQVEEVPPATLREAGTLALCHSSAWDKQIVISGMVGGHLTR